MKIRIHCALSLAVILALMFNSLALAYVNTDQPDYAPGSTVTIYGDNSDGAGFFAGEVIQVSVNGPNGYTAACEATADETGGWSCQVTLWDDVNALGTYYYTATGISSGVSQSGTFTDSAIRIQFKTSGLPTGTSVTVNWTRFVPSCNGNKGSGSTTFFASGPSAQVQACEQEGQNTFVYSFPALITAGGVTYSLLSSSPASGSEFASDALITATYVIACTPPTITDQPDPLSVTVGGSASFTLAATGTLPLTYQWYKNEAAIGTNSNSYSITTVFSSDAGNYKAVVSNSCGNTTSNSVALTVNKADTTTKVTVADAIYDGNPHGGTAVVTGPGGLNQSLPVIYTGRETTVYGPSTSAPVNAGEYKASASFAETADYNTSSDSQNFSIEKADPVCSINGYSGVYDGKAHGASGSCNGSGTLDLGASYTNAPGGTAHWTFTGNGNYQNASGDVAIVIGQADAVCIISGYSGVYDADFHGATGTCSGLGGENAGSLMLGDSFKDAPGGTAHWVFTGNGNYKNQSGDVSIVISQADAVCNVTGYSGVYDAALHGASGSCSGVGGETAGTLDLGDSFKDVPGGTAHWVFTANGNYKDQSGNVNITISQADAVCNIAGYSGVYDATLHGATGSCTGVGGESAGTLDLGLRFKDVPGGTAHWVFIANGNYKNQSGEVNIAIAKADASCSISGYSGTYDAAFHGATGSCSGISGEIAGTLDFGNSFKDVPGGTAHWVFTGNGNYKDQNGDAVIDISKADAICSISGYSGIYDAVSHGAAGSCTGIGGESAGSLDLGNSYKNVPGGTANWIFTANGNYKDQNGSVPIDISKADADCEINGYTGDYDALSHGASGTCTGIGGETPGVLVLGNSFINVPGGTAHWVFTGNGNYEDENGDAAIVLNKIDATCNIVGYSGTYNGDSHGASGTCSGIGGESAGVINLGDSFTNVPGGTANWTFTGNQNYKNQSGSVKIELEKADPSIVVNGYSGVYDGDPHGATGSVVGVKAEALAGLDLGESFTNVPGGTAAWTFIDTTGNYNDKSGGVSIIITKADPTCSVSGVSVVYDTILHGASGTCVGVKNEVLAGLDLGETFKDYPGGTAHWIFTDQTGNYENDAGDVEIEISKADASCTIQGYSGIYDAAYHHASGSCLGIGGEAAGTLDYGAIYKNVPGGSANWTFTGNNNYKDQNGSVEIEISKADPTIVVKGYSGMYDGLAHGATGSAKGVEAETLAGLDLGTTFINVPGGTAHWTFTDATGNYNNEAGDVAIVISKAPLTVTADNKTMIFGSPLPPFTFTYSGFVNGEDASVVDTAPGCTVGSIPMYGIYPITCSGGVDGNYSFTYVNGVLTVQAWTLQGFYQPVDMNGIYNVSKNGSTVPLKFEIFAGLTELKTIDSVKSLTYSQTTCSTSAITDEIETLATGNTVLRFDTTGDQFIFNWKTPSTANKCYRVTMATFDGSTLVAYFKLK